MYRNGSLSRRRVLGGAAVASGMGLALSPAGPASAFEAARKHRRPPKLSRGDLVMVISPGGASTASDVDKGVAVLEGFGLRVALSEHALDSYGYFSAPDAERLADLDAAIADPEVRAIMAARGGYGTQRIVDEADIEHLARDPKLLIGYSDITALHLAATARAGLSCLHAPMVAWDDSNTPETVEALRKAMMTTEDVTLRRDPSEPSAAVKVPGRATGRLTGGNLSLFASEPRNLPDMEEMIWFLEDVDEEPYRIDGMITHLLRDGKLDRLAAIALGQFTDVTGDPGTWTLAEMLRDRLEPLGVPILGGLPIGHGDDPRVLPMGVTATLDADAGTLVVESAVSDS